MYKVILNGKNELQVPKSEGEIFFINGKEYQIHKFENDKEYFLIESDQKQYKVRVLNIDWSTKTFLLKLNGLKHEVRVKDRLDLLLEKMGLNSNSTASMNQIKAPMPGLIHEVSVSAGDLVKKGDKVLVLEAMKMENLIKSPGDGTVREIKVTKGDSVEKNQILIEF